MRVETGAWQSEPTERSAAGFLAARGLGDRLRAISLDEARAIADSPRFTAALPRHRQRDRAAGASGPRACVGSRSSAGCTSSSGRRCARSSARDRRSCARAHGAVKADQVVLTTGSWAAGMSGLPAQLRRDRRTRWSPPNPSPIGCARSAGRRTWASATVASSLYYLRPTDDGRIVIGGGALGRRIRRPRRTAGRSPTTDGSRRRRRAGCSGCSRSSRACGSRTRGAGRSTRRRRSCPSSGRSSRATCMPGSGSPGTGCRRPCWAGASWPRSCRAGATEWTSMPVVGREAKSPPEPLRFPAVWLASRALELGDRRQDAGRPRGAVLDLVGGAPLAYRNRLTRRAARRRDRGQ